VGISAEVLKGPLGAIKRGFAIDDPLFMIEPPREYVKVPRLFEMVDTVGEYQGTRFERFFKQVKELSFEQRRHDPDRDEESFSG